MASGSAARNSRLTSVTPGPPPSTAVAEEDIDEETEGRDGGLIPSWFCRTSRRMSSGKAAKKDGSTPSGRLIPTHAETKAKKRQTYHRGLLEVPYSILILYHFNIGSFLYKEHFPGLENSRS